MVGAGIAGLLLATRLARQNRKVIVLESGAMAFDPDIHALNEIDDPTGRYARELTGRYRGLGGSSSRWGGRMIPISTAESGLRDHVCQPQWPLSHAALEPYQREVEALFAVGHDSFEEIDTVRPGAAGLLLETSEHFKARWAKCPSFKRCNIVTMLGAELRASKNVTVWLNATVSDFELDRAQGRLRAISARSLSGRTITVRAEEFVVAAGTIESTRLLLLLDAASDDHAFAHTDALGRYFQDHLKAEIATVDRQRAQLTNHLLSSRFVRGTRRDLHLELSHAAQRDDAVSGAFVYVSMDMANSGLDAIKAIARGMQQKTLDPRHIGTAMRDVGLISAGAFWRLWYQQLYVPASVRFHLTASIEQLPDPQNRITLSTSTDRLGVRKPLFDWRPRAADERTFQSTVKHLKHYWQRSGFDKLCPLVWNPAMADPGHSIIDRAEACAHPSGSARMGTDRASSVVGPDLRCHNVPNLAIASAAVFPTAGSANPTLTLMKLALWLADSYPQMSLL
ncbi:MAG TPA: GMC family oxidoreductase [Devosia sp.]|nr:GMC family oxidoreductase [Devosia sp.]